MKQKTRYNVRLAEKKGVVLRVGTKSDFPMLYKMYAETSVRDGFVIRDEGYYKAVWGLFMRSNVDTFTGSQVETFQLSNFPTFNQKGIPC
jgi:lipid II:glycine glycyltransferase (peptidoglycan interpeptide bridge formation enzyme)